MKPSDLQTVLLPDGRAALHCESIEVMRVALRVAVKLDFRNNVTIGNVHDYETGDPDIAWQDGNALLSCRFGFPGKTKHLIFRIPADAIRAYQAERAQAAAEPEPEAEVQPPEGWEWGELQELELELQEAAQ